MANKKELRKNFDKAVFAYVDALLDQWGLDSYYGDFIANDTGGVYAHGDELFINLQDLIFIVDNDITENQYREWQDYYAWALEFGFSTPNLRSFVHGCPRIDETTRDHLKKLQKNLIDACDKAQENTY